MSAAQWTNPDPKSAVTIPQKAATSIVLKLSIRTWNIMKKKLTTISVIQIPTQIHSCVRLPAILFKLEGWSTCWVFGLEGSRRSVKMLIVIYLIRYIFLK